MKKGYKRLLVFEIIFIIFLILNSFFGNVLSKYNMLLFLSILSFIFYKLFGFEKDNHRYLKDLVLETIIFVITFLLLYYLLGIVIGFVKTNYYNINGLTKYIIPLIFTIILKEILRYMITSKAEGSKILMISTIIFFILIDITSALYVRDFSSNYTIFLFFALVILPSISLNISFSFLTLKMGYKPLIIYSLIINLFSYLLPIIPNPNEYIYSVIIFCLPIIYLYCIYLFYEKENRRKIIRNEKKYNFIPLIFSSIFVVFLVYFTSGYFRFWAIAVASGSMEKSINKGDVVVIEKINNKYSTLKVSDVIAFKKDNIVVVHRLINIINSNGKYYFYTKGDNNISVDNFVIEEDMVIGKVIVKIPYIGKPTVWLNNL